jgi:YD repeat-containing protein
MISASSDAGDCVTLWHEGRSVKGLCRVEQQRKIPLSYCYDDAGILTSIERPEGRSMAICYDDAGRVAALLGPIAPEGEMAPICRYAYEDEATRLFDAEGHLTLYRYDRLKRISCIERWEKEERLLRLDYFSWEGQSGDLLSHQICDAEGRLLKETSYRYDTYHNVICDLSSCCIVSKCRDHATRVLLRT